jgi:hypothetical protein
VSEPTREELEAMAASAGISVEDLEHGAKLQIKLYDAVRELTLHLYKSSGDTPTNSMELTENMVRVLKRETMSPVLYEQAEASAQRWYEGGDKSEGR